MAASLQQSIASFEEILRILPRDRPALEFLAVAYGQIGDAPRRAHTVFRLVEVLLDEGDLEAAEQLVPTLREIGGRGAEDAIGRIASRRTADAPKASARSAEENAFTAVRSELDLLHRLRARKVLSQAVSDAAEKSLFDLLAESDVPMVSALAAIARESEAEGEHALAELADMTGVVPVPLSAYAPDAELVRCLPARLVVQRGVLPFARLADTLLVAVLNPVDTALRQEIATAARGPCRFFLTTPREMEEALRRIFGESGGAT